MCLIYRIMTLGEWGFTLSDQCLASKGSWADSYNSWLGNLVWWEVMLYLQHKETSQSQGTAKWLLWSVIVLLLSLFLDYYITFWQRIWMVKLGTATGDRGKASTSLLSVMILPWGEESCRQRGIPGGLCIYFAAWTYLKEHEHYIYMLNVAYRWHTHRVCITSFTGWEFYPVSPCMFWESDVGYKSILRLINLKSWSQTKLSFVT